MNNATKKRNVLSVAMLLAPIVICLTVFIDLMVNIENYQTISNLGVEIWTYFSFTLLVALGCLFSVGYVFVNVIVLKKDVKHIRTVIIISHLAFLLELFYIIQYVAMLGNNASGLSIAALVFGLLGVIGYFVSMGLKKGPNFIAYYIASAFYFIFMILMTALLTNRDNGMHIILLVFYSIAITLAGAGIYYFYLRKEK